jgi:nucleoside-diphosphate-sugar epimerase
MGRPERATRTCAITGASGYVGSCVADRLLHEGWEVRALTRTAPSKARVGFTQVDFRLGHDCAAGMFDGVDALVHLAYDFEAMTWADIERINVDGSRRLFAAAREAGVSQIVCVSTIAAFPSTRSRYGRAKLEIERLAFDVGAAVVRPGLVWGPDGAAMFGSLRRAVNRLPVIPMPVPGRLELSLVHEDDLGMLVGGLLDRWPEASGMLFVAASRETVTFAELLRSLASRRRRPPILMRFPWKVAWLGLRLLEAVGANPPFHSDSLVSLVAADAEPLARATAGTESYGARFRPYALV